MGTHDKSRRLPLSRRALFTAGGVLAAAGTLAGVLVATGTVAGAAGGISSKVHSAPNGYHACVDPNTWQLKDYAGRPTIWPNDAQHPVYCAGGRIPVEFASQEQAKAAQAAAMAAQAAADKAAAAADPSKHVLANGPYPGATKLQYGRNSESQWAPDGTLQQSWVTCPDGGVAIGGGFARGDEALADAMKINVLTSSPAYVDSTGKVTSITGSYTPIQGNPDDAYVPNGWVVEGVNTGTAQQIVRPYVVCSVASQTP